MEGRKHSSSRHAAAAGRDLWAAVRSGSVRDVDTALSLLKKGGGTVDARDRFGATALHIAVWRNHVPIVRRLLEAGADPDVRDGESSWGSLHRALHFGHLAVAGALIEGSASLNLEDAAGRTPTDLVSGPLKPAIASGGNKVAGGTEVFSWGNGSNYQLGTGTAGIQRVPCRVEALQGLEVAAISAAKFHSVAVTSRGEVFSWGYGRGGRLGLEDYSGQVAVITPKQVISGLGARRVKTVAAAKHHTIVATDGGEVFSWGTNREGQLGYPSVDTQSTPRRVSTLKAKVVAVAAANKHSIAVTEAGEVFTWGSNKEGQLGYGTSNSASNCVPRSVEYLRGKRSVAVSAAKYHTIALVEGEVFTWGHKLVTPRRVSINRNVKKCGSAPLKFHRCEVFRIVAVAAGVIDSTAVSEEGLVFSWRSADPNLHAGQVLSLAGHQAVSVSAGKFRTAVTTVRGDVLVWDADQANSPAPVPLRTYGIKQVLHLAVGESHSLAIAGIYVPPFPLNPDVSESPSTSRLHDEDYASEDELGFVAAETPKKRALEVPSLRDLCQKAIAETVIEPKNALQLLDIAESLGADELRRHCEEFILHNLGYILTISASAFGATRPSVLADLERVWDASSSQAWSHRHLPVPSATQPAVLDSEDDDDESEPGSRTRKGHGQAVPLVSLAGFLRAVNPGDDRRVKQLRAIRKKLQQIEALELKLSKGQPLDEQQRAKISSKSALLASLKELEPGAVLLEKPASSSNQSKSHKRKKNKASSKNIEALSKSVEASIKSVDEPSQQDKTSPEKAWQEKASTEKAEKVCTNQDVKAEPRQEQQPAAWTDLQEPAATLPVEAKKKASKSRKGGLSMFLSGELEKKPVEQPLPLPPPVIVKSDGPAWGGAPAAKASPSLREIQSEQKAMAATTKPQRPKSSSPQQEVANPSGVLLRDFVVRPSAPIAVASPTKAAAPAWTGSTSPVSVPSLRDIQLQQVKQKQPHHSRGSPQASSPLGALASVGSPEAKPSAWFKPDTSSPSSIRCIQIEERAMKDLRRLYKNVKIVDQQQWN